ncbi:SDR family NAD(P)-dependent oxidoreductase, partial [Streptomyces sp. NPDC047315]|uniref:SDR family NAD(P)-dependent oxidoreductase n=1 Tax=Streptomyces sp. NPDC047315 TaxID=3155142 RepID=UPI0033E30134
MGQLDGRVAVITGAGAGLGREHALLFAAEGAKVVVNDLANAKSVVEEITAAGGEAVAVEGSVADLAVGRTLVDAAVESFGDLHVVVNNAGVIRDAMLVNMTEEQFDLVVAVHLKGAFSVAQAAARYWRERSKAGHTADRAIVQTSSGSGLHGNIGQWNYSAVKAGVAIQVVNAARELGRYGVRANAIA